MKAGTGEFANTVFNAPTSGTDVWADTNGNFTLERGGKDGDRQISHIILCGTSEEPEDGEIRLTFANPRIPGAIAVTKIDDLGDKVPGVTFELFADENDNGELDMGESLGTRTTTAEVNPVVWEGLEWRDDYRVLEVSAPAGYEPAGDLITGTYSVDLGGTTEVTRINNRIKSINVVVNSFCEADAPFYSLRVDAQNLANLPVKVEWLQATADGKLLLVDGQPVPATNADTSSPDFGTPLVDNYVLDGDTLDKPKELWKGAALDSSRKIVKWPGWILNEDDSWTQIPDGGVRPAAILRVSVNPTVDSAALYPPATPECNANPPSVPGLDKSATPPSGSQVAPGQEIAYEVKLTNKGGQAIMDDLVDTLPAGVKYIPGSATRDGAASEPSVSGQTLTWSAVTVPVDDPATTVNEGMVTFKYRVTVNADAATGLTLLNTASWAKITDTTIQGVNVVPTAPVADIEDEVVEEDEEVVAAEEDEDLADTGANGVGNLVGAALLAMLAGGLMVVFGRRRRYNA